MIHTLSLHDALPIWFGPAGLAAEFEAQVVQPQVGGAGAAILGAELLQLLGVVPFQNPVFPQRRQSLADVDPDVRVGVGAGGVVDIKGSVGLATEGGGGVVQGDFAHGDADIGTAAFDIDLAGPKKGLHRVAIDAGALVQGDLRGLAGHYSLLSFPCGSVAQVQTHLPEAHFHAGGGGKALFQCVQTGGGQILPQLVQQGALGGGGLLVLIAQVHFDPAVVGVALPLGVRLLGQPGGDLGVADDAGGQGHVQVEQVTGKAGIQYVAGVGYGG